MVALLQRCFAWRMVLQNILRKEPCKYYEVAALDELLILMPGRSLTYKG